MLGVKHDAKISNRSRLGLLPIWVCASMIWIVSPSSCGDMRFPFHLSARQYTAREFKLNKLDGAAALQALALRLFCPCD